jgi:PPP family 3-phenylpropionic acid transporter
MAAFLVAALGASLRLPLRVEVRQRRVRRSAWRLLAEPELALFLVAVFLGQCGQAAYDVCFSLRLFELKVARSDLAFALAWDIGTGAEVVLLAFSAPLLRAFSPTTLFAFALGCGSLRWAAIALVRSAGAVLLLQPLHAITWALGWVASLTHASRRYPAELGTVQGLFTASLGTGAVLGMVAWGTIFYRSGGSAVFGGAACVSACACAFAVGLERRLRTTDARDAHWEPSDGRRDRSSIRRE